MPKLDPELTTTKFPASFYYKAFAIGFVLGGLLEGLMATTGFYNSLRVAEGKKLAREEEEMMKLIAEMDKEERK